MSQNLCKLIECPYFNEKTNGFGCQRYMSASHCHLLYKPDANSQLNQLNPTIIRFFTAKLWYVYLSITQYAIYSGINEWTEKQIDLLREKNNSYLESDPHYQDDIKFSREKKDWVPEGAWLVKELVNKQEGN